MNAVLGIHKGHEKAAVYCTWPVADVGHGATLGGDVAQVDLLGLDLDLWASVDGTVHYSQGKKSLGGMEVTNGTS